MLFQFDKSCDFLVKLYCKLAEMSEWLKEHDWKSCNVKAFAGSNPVLCAIVSG